MIRSTRIPKEKPIVYFTPVAWCKLKALVNKTTTECAMHGTVIRDTNKPNVFLVYDILVYPQKVSAAFVTMDDDKYVEWLMSLPDITVNQLRFQAHSHVNMGVDPSGTDTQTWEDFAKNVDDYYIFAIFNKKDGINIEVWDLVEGLIYNGTDVTTSIMLSEENTIDSWVLDTCKQNIIENKTITSYGKHYDTDLTDMVYSNYNGRFGFASGYADEQLIEDRVITAAHNKNKKQKGKKQNEPK